MESGREGGGGGNKVEDHNANNFIVKAKLLSKHIGKNEH